MTVLQVIQGLAIIAFAVYSFRKYDETEHFTDGWGSLNKWR